VTRGPGLGADEVDPVPVPSRLGAIGLFLLLLGASLLFFRGALETSDEQLMALTSQAIAERFSLTFEREVYGQHFTGYGVGTPVIGVPVYLLEKVLRGPSLLGEADLSLMPLANGVLFALTGVLLALLLEGERRWLHLGITMLVSPLLAASLTFYSEPLATFGLVGLVVCFWRASDNGDRERSPTPWHILALVFCALALLARLAMLPLLLLTIVWGVRMRGTRQVLGGALAGIALGTLGTMAQNWSLRGSPFATGYAGQDFTTPVLTGLHGLLASPERGLLVFFPLAVMPYLAWHHLGGRARSLLVLCSALTLFWAVMHALFWTWHGGWTTGPRFLLPCIALYTAPIAMTVAAGRRLEWHLRLLLSLAFVWCGLLSLIYCRHSAYLWWNRTWGFHQEENQWLFLPQLSLWQAWFDGVPLPDARSAFPRSVEILFSGLAAIALILSAFPLLRPFLPPPQRPKPVGLWIEVDRSLLVVLGVIATTILVYSQTGPRGFRAPDDPVGETPRLSHLLVSGDKGVYEGWIDNPLATPIKFSLKANALYRIFLNDQLVLEQTESVPQHLQRFEYPVEPGKLYQLKVEVGAKRDDPRLLFEMYWTWGGNGTYLAPVGGEYVVPRPLTPVEAFFTRIWRRKFLIGAGVLALLLLLKGLPARSPLQEQA
jgi:hypothetical protein